MCGIAAYPDPRIAPSQSARQKNKHMSCSAREAVSTAMPTDQEIEDKRNAERDAERDKHNRLTGGGQYAR